MALKQDTVRLYQHITRQSLLELVTTVVSGVRHRAENMAHKIIIIMMHNLPYGSPACWMLHHKSLDVDHGKKYHKRKKNTQIQNTYSTPINFLLPKMCNFFNITSFISLF